ncbi:MAG: glycoside hydrolase family 97 protein [Acidobacteria bacterium]|nr:glycoside hydrolase family 97 protein [Acidobacteriota bacterium]
MQAGHRKTAGLFSLRVTGLTSGQQQGFDIVLEDGIGGVTCGETGNQDGLQEQDGHSVRSAGYSHGRLRHSQPWKLYRRKSLTSRESCGSTGRRRSDSLVSWLVEAAIRLLLDYVVNGTPKLYLCCVTETGLPFFGAQRRQIAESQRTYPGDRLPVEPPSEMVTLFLLQDTRIAGQPKPKIPMDDNGTRTRRRIDPLKTALAASILCALHVVSNPALPAQDFHLNSPNGEVTVTVGLKELRTPYPKGVRPYYRIGFNGATVVRDSWLGLDLKGGPPLGRDLVLLDWEASSGDERYRLPYGTRGELRNAYRQGVLRLRESTPSGRRLDLVFRAYDEGAAFRYRVPPQPGLSDVDLLEENSTFFFPEGCRAWVLQLRGFATNYESEFNPQPLWRLQPGAIVGLPLLLQTLAGSWLAVTEANISDYAGMYLTPVPGIPETLESRLSPHPRRPGVKVRTAAPLQSPWRVFLLGRTPGKLIENNGLLLHLNEPTRIADPSWIRPGKAAWHWWNGTSAKGVGFEPGMNTATMKHYLDFAADHNLEYLQIDAGWHQGTEEEGDITRSRSELDLPSLIGYGRKRGVGILLWLHWKRARAQMEEAFKLYEDWGIAGVKIDFMDRDDQEMVGFYHQAARRAANHRLLVNFHGAYKPDGLRRTWPNIITREAVLGLEWNRLGTRCNPTHDLTLPFTRMLAGPMDYTPGAFRTVHRKDFEPRSREPLAQGTRAHQLAMYVVYESPLQMLVDYPAAYRGQPGIEFLGKVPTSWDATRVLDGSVGEFITVARRSGAEWYVGSMTDWDGRELSIPMRFLGPGLYRAEVYADVEGDPAGVRRYQLRVRSSDAVTARLEPGGGHVMRICPEKP